MKEIKKVKKLKKNYRHNGFTLIELLIVLVVIGILSAMMMIAVDEMVSSARATQIINDLNQLKRAVTAWYIENDGVLTQSGNGYTIGGEKNKSDESKQVHNILKENPSIIKDYLGNSNFSLNQGKSNYTTDFFTEVGGYGVYMGKGNTILMVLYRISDNSKQSDQKRLREKLKAKAKSTGLLTYSNGKDPTQYDGGNFVFIQVLRTDK